MLFVNATADVFPPAKTPLLLFPLDAPASPSLATVKSPKSAAFPGVEIVT